MCDLYKMDRSAAEVARLFNGVEVGGSSSSGVTGGLLDG